MDYLREVIVASDEANQKLLKALTEYAADETGLDDAKILSFQMTYRVEQTGGRYYAFLGGPDGEN